MSLSNLSVAALGAVDTGVAGHLGSAGSLAAAAIGGQLLSYFVWCCGFLRMGTTGLSAGAAGRGDRPEGAAVLGRGLALALGLSALLGLALAVTLPWLLALFGPAPAVRDLAAGYVLIRLAGLPAALAVLALVGWFVGRGEAGLPLVMILATNLVNAGLDLLLALHLGLGLDGLAIARGQRDGLRFFGVEG